MKAFVPEIANLPSRKMLIIQSVGVPNKVGEIFFAALYGTAYGTKFKTYKPKGIEMKDVIFMHEVEYLTKPESKVVKTIIRHRIGV